MASWTRTERRFLDRQHALPALEWAMAVEPVLQPLSALVECEPSAAVGRKFIGDTGGLQHWLEGDAVSRILRGDPDGWDVMHDYLEYQHWGTLMFEEIYQRDTRPDPHRLRLTIRAFSEVLLALHLGRRPAADATLLRLSREAREKECRHWKHSTGALAFQVRLYELWTGRDADFDMGKLPPLGEYEQLLDPTCVGERYRASLAWACAEHIAQTVDTKKRCPPFNIGLFRTLPMEIVLWQRYRERLGLDAETDQHPLLESPLALRTPPPRSAPPSALRTLLNRAIPHMDAYLRESA